MAESAYARVPTSLLRTYTWSILVILHQGCKSYCLRYNHIILSLSMFHVKTSQWHMHSAVSLHDKTELKGYPTQLSRTRVQSIQEATSQDKTLQLPIQQMLEGWPESCRKLLGVLIPFWQWRADLSIEDSCITWKGRFFIPIALRDNCLEVLHNGHPCVTKMSLRAKGSMFLPNILKANNK